MKPPRASPLPPFGVRIWRGVTMQLFLVTVLPLTILVLGIVFGGLHLHHESMRALVADRNLRAAQAAANTIGVQIQHRGEVLQLLASRMTAGADFDAEFALAETSLQAFDGGILVLGADRHIAAAAGSSVVQQLAGSEGWGSVLSGMDAAGSPAGIIFLPVVVIQDQVYLPILSINSSGYALVGLVSTQGLLTEVLATIGRDDAVSIIVVDQDYRTLYQRGQLYPAGEASSHPGMQSALSGSGEVDYFPSTDGEIVVTHNPIEPVQWALMIEEPWEEIASPWLSLTQNAPLVAIPILALAVLALWFGLSQIVQPLQVLEEKTGALARGDFEAIRQPVGGVPEVRHLQTTLVNMAQQLKEAEDSLHSYIGAITDSAENERRSLARELHDGTLQNLIALGQYTQYAMHWNKDEKVGKTLEQVLTLSESGTRDLRRMVRGLRPIYIEDLGLAAAMDMLTAESQPAEQKKIRFQKTGSERRLKGDVEMAVYRMVQQALNNALQHADAQNIEVLLNYNPDEVSIEIRDDGKGFALAADTAHYARQGHYGLLGLYERSELIGAKLNIQTSPGHGTRVEIHLPYPADDAPAHPGEESTGKDLSDE